MYFLLQIVYIHVFSMPMYMV